VLIIDRLQYKPHPSHLSIDQALWWIEKLDPKRAYLTHMHVPLDYETVPTKRRITLSLVMTV
jgi:phosphoribosyl 1,2-cyclic phosphate phosphodiesterase